MANRGILEEQREETLSIEELPRTASDPDALYTIDGRAVNQKKQKWKKAIQLAILRHLNEVRVERRTHRAQVEQR